MPLSYHCCRSVIKTSFYELLYNFTTPNITHPSGLQLIESGPPMVGRAICFIQSTDSNINFTQTLPHRQALNNI